MVDRIRVDRIYINGQSAASKLPESRSADRSTYCSRGDGTDADRSTMGRAGGLRGQIASESVGLGRRDRELGGRLRHYDLELLDDKQTQSCRRTEDSSQP